MELRPLRYLQAVAVHGSFTGAARVLNISQSTISEQLANLEDEIGVVLLTRSGRRTELTQAGEAFVRQAQQILSDVDHAVEVARGIHRGEAGRLRIGFFSGGIGINFPNLIQAFRRRHPLVQLSLVEMTSPEQWSALRGGQIDIGFTRRLEPEVRSELRSILLHHDPILAILPRNHRAAPGPVDLRDLANEKFVLSSREISPAVYNKVIELCSEAGFSPRIASISTVWASVVLMVQAGEGVSLLPMNEQQFRMRDLSFCRLKARNAYVEYVMAWAPRRDTPLIRAFRQIALAHRKKSQMQP